MWVWTMQAEDRVICFVKVTEVLTDRNVTVMLHVCCVAYTLESSFIDMLETIHPSGFT